MIVQRSIICVLVVQFVAQPCSGDLLPVKYVFPWPTDSASPSINVTIDGNWKTGWISSPCRAGAWTRNGVFNALVDTCATGICSRSCDMLQGTPPLSSSTDHNPYTGGVVSLNHGDGKSWAIFPFPGGPRRLTSLYIRGAWPDGTIFEAVSESGQVVKIDTLGSQMAYLDLTYPAPAMEVSELRVRAATRDGVMRGYCYAGVGDCKSMTITEVGAQMQGCFEQLTFDLGTPAVVQSLDTDFSGTVNATVALSLDGNSFRSVGYFLGYVKGTRTLKIANVTARFVRIRYETQYLSSADTYQKVYVQEVQIFGTPLALPLKCPNLCSGHGICNSSGRCDCDSGYSGEDCGSVRCVPSCSSQGKCIEGRCECNIGFKGVDCSENSCPLNCWNHGTCIAGTCKCDDGWAGSDCRYSIFNGTGNSRSQSVYLFDRGAKMPRFDNYTVTQPPAITDFYNSKMDSSKCPATSPFVCEDGSCALSKGACALKLRNSSAIWDTNPFLPAPVTSRNGTTAFASSNTQNAYKVIDGNDGANGFWQSGQCYPTGYMEYKDVNIFYGACLAGRCNSTSAPSWNSATDGNANTASGFSLVNGLAKLMVSLNVPSQLAAVTLRISTNTGVDVLGITQSSQQIVFGRVTSSYTMINIDLNSSQTFKAVLLQSNQSFSVFEVGARKGPCFEFVTVDLGNTTLISALSIRHWASGSGVMQTVYEVSADGTSWSLARPPVSPTILGSLDTELNPAVSCRYIRVRHDLQEQAATRVMIWEITAWDAWGKFGNRTAAAPNVVSFRDLLGVNGIWAWGGQGWSNLAHAGWGPKRFSKAASHARNYHNWNWDVKDPTTIPDFESMSCGSGTNGQWWLSWDWEYAGWNAAGLEVDACIQFTSSMFTEAQFKDAYTAGYNYGFAFARHFGKSHGVGLVTHIEVGNEPWIAGMGYSNPVFYSEILLGMARGIKDADPMMRVLPAIFANRDMPPRVNVTHLPYLDAFNVHAYSYMQTPIGRTGVHPEHNMSSLHEVDFMIRFRDANAPGLPVYLTEWGWDSDGGGEGCGPPPERAGDAPFPECVTENAQALYAVRGALILARKGLARLTWYFYGNIPVNAGTWDRTKGLFARSGLASSQDAGFRNKQALYALEVFVQTLGHTHFMTVLQENADGFVYLLGDGNSAVTHVVAWRPVDENVTGAVEVSFSLPSTPAVAWLLGLRSYQLAPLPMVSGGMWRMNLSRIPVAVGLASASWLQCNPTCSLNGLCHNGTCMCSPNFAGPTCSDYSCENNCWQRGTCQANGTCVCDAYLSHDGSGEYQRCTTESGTCRDSPAKFDAASNCSIAACKDQCNYHGVCSSSGCVCDIGWSGSSCEVPPCPFNCRSHGVCQNGTCVCRPGFQGDSCQWPNDVVQSVASGCDRGKPFWCDVGGCAVSAGECAQRKASITAESWSASPYLAVPLTALNGTRAFSSSNAQSAYLAIDGNDGANGFWRSGQCYPTGYMGMEELNILLGACLAGRCNSTSSTPAGLVSATDANTDTAVFVPLSGGTAKLTISLDRASQLAAISIKLVLGLSVDIVGVTDNSQQVVLGRVTASYTLLNFDLDSTQLFTAVHLRSNQSFTVYDIGARRNKCFESVTVDLSVVSLVSALSIRHWAGTSNVLETLYELSVDGTTWTLARPPVSPQLIGSLDTELSPPILCRYIRVKHNLPERVSTSVYIWEITAWDVRGRYGKPSAAAPNGVNFRSLLGVNGIWQWGAGGLATPLNKTYGATTYQNMSSHARNYHNWNWDVIDPDNVPPFSEMVPRGSIDFGILPGHSGALAQDWLNWDTEYTSWKRAGLQVEVSLQFTTDMFPQSVFTDRYKAGYNYGFAFSKHFGPSIGTGDVSVIEVGNEPWIAGMGYSDPAFYSDLLLGMARGVKDGDPLMRVLPAIFSNRDVPPRVNATHLPYLDAFNVHAYSYMQTPIGRTGVHPEHNMSSLHEVDFMIRFRDANAPGLPVYLTEWGWDSDGGGEGCGPPPERAGDAPFPECVTENAQALYAVRGALILARKGLARLTWYFYGNIPVNAATWDKTKGLFARSGLVSSSATGFQKKQALYALEVFVQTLGHTYFMTALQENADGFVYLLGDGNLTVTHVVAWRPVDENVTGAVEVSFSLPSTPAVAWLLGLRSYQLAPLPMVSGELWKVSISATPVAIQLATPVPCRSSVRFAVMLSVSSADFAARQADFTNSVASLAGRSNAAARVVRSEPAPGQSAAVYVDTEILAGSQAEAQSIVGALTIVSLQARFQTQGLSVAGSAFLSAPRAVVTPVPTLPTTCSLDLSWDSVVAMKVAARSPTCPDLQLAAAGSCRRRLVSGGLGADTLSGLYEVWLCVAPDTPGLLCQGIPKAAAGSNSSDWMPCFRFNEALRTFEYLGLNKDARLVVPTQPVCRPCPPSSTPTPAGA